MTHCFIIVYSDRDSWHLQASLTEGPHTVPSELRILTTKLYTTSHYIPYNAVATDVADMHIDHNKT